MKNPEIFQGENKIKSLKNYFEGWYFKHSEGKFGISFIPGINIQNGEKYAFIQIITKENSYYINYNFDEFKYSSSPFSIQIGNNFFSKDKIYVDINTQDINIHGELFYTNLKEIQKNIISPNIMGPFSHLPFMECNHAILSMKHTIQGNIYINGFIFSFNNGQGYIEKDWGSSFPKSYLWCEANSFGIPNCSLFFSVADIPLNMFTFKGFICVFILNNKEYRFATYNNSRIKKCRITGEFADILIEKGKYSLNIKCNNINGIKLISPVKGSMERPVLETINSVIEVVLKKSNNIIYSGQSTNAGIEIVL